MGNKFKNVKVEVDGIKFDSKKEANRWLVLKEYERQHVITDLQRQVVYELIPKQELRRPKVGKKGRHTYLELPVNYVADFQYRLSTGELIVEDVKSPITRTKDYIIKRKLMKFIHNIELSEV